MTYLIIITVLLLFLLILMMLQLNKPCSDTFVVTQMKSEDLGKLATIIADDMRKTRNSGGAPQVKQKIAIIKKAYKNIVLKVKKNEEVFQFEKLLYENYYSILLEFSKIKYKNFAYLPHKNKNSRIVLLAEKYFFNNNCNLDKISFEKFVNAFNSVTPLKNSEIAVISDAFRYVIIEKIASLAKNSLKIAKLKKAAQNDPEPQSKYVTEDTYLYYFRHFGKKLETKTFHKMNEIDVNNLDYNFSRKLIENYIIMTNCIQSYRDSKDVFSTSFVLQLSSLNNLMIDDCAYAKMNDESKFLYCATIEKLAKLFNASEKAIAQGALKLSKQYGVHFGEILFDYRYALKMYLHTTPPTILSKKNTSFDQRAFVLLVVVVNLAIAILTGLFVGGIATRISAIICVLFASLSASEYIVITVAKYFIPERAIPRMNYQNVPVDGKTLVIISKYICGLDDAKKIVEKIIAMQTVNNDPEVQFCLLADLQTANSEILDSDNEIFDYFQTFRNDKRFCFLVRKRTKNNNKYCGYERKRGAIHNLNESLCTGNYSAFSYVSYTPSKPKFVMLLDEDSEIINGGIKLAINTMLHPLNEKYDLMTFESKYQLSSLKTFYSKKYLFDSGVESYNNYSNFYYNLTGYSIFCGKGIYRLEKYKSKLHGKLPENRVLSHDIIEGAILDTGNLGINIYEEAPKSFVADSERANRWSRGDILLLPFANSHFCSKYFYKYVIVSNFFKILSPIFEFVLWILLAMTGEIQLFLPLFFAAFAIPIIGIGFDLTSVDRNIRTRYILGFVGQKILFLLGHIVFLPFFAVNAMILLFKMLFKSIFAKDKLIEWKTFSQTQKSSNFYKHLSVVAASCIVSVIIFGALQNIALLVYCLVFIVAINAVYFAKFSKKTNIKLKVKDKNQLKDIADKTMEFFDEVLKNNSLPSDHIQFYPQKFVCQYTSPTNIGFGLMGILSGFKLERYSIEITLKKLKEQIKQIENLEKWQGNLYNWYDIKTNFPCEQKFVSSVDSGNLLAALITVENFCMQNNGEELSESIGQLIDETNLKALYDETKNQFYIGYNQNNNVFEGHYDILASEARLLVYIASCRFADSSPWLSLSRQNIGECGNTLVSWSGTSFEYLMPQIFLPTYSNSLIGNSAYRALKMMSKSKCSNLWGISESGYFAFDKDMNYQYYAFGLEQLGLKAQQSKCVISPYASILGLEFLPKKVIANIDKLSENGLLGKYGFFESVDFTNTKKIIYSCMSHHQGMIISAVINTLYDGYFRDLFITNKRESGGKLLIQEKANYTKHERRLYQDFVYDKEEKNNYFESITVNEGVPIVNVLTNGEYSVVTDSLGRGYSKCKKSYINKFKPDIYSNFGGFVICRENGKLFSPTYAPLKGDTTGFSCQFGVYESIFKNANDNCEMKIFIPSNENSEVRKVTLRNNDNQTKKIDISFFERLSLTSQGEDSAHPTFSDMFVSTFFDSDSKALIAHRKSRSQLGDCFCGMAVKGLENIEYETNLENIVSQNFGEYKISIFEKEKKAASIGDVLNPCIGFVSYIELQPMQTLEFSIVIAFADDFESLQGRLEQINSTEYEKYAYESSKLRSLSKAYKYLSNKQISEQVAILAQNLLFRNYASLQLQEIWGDEKELPIGLSKERKFVFLEYDGNGKKLFDVAHVVAYCNLAGLECDFVIIYHEKDEYNAIVKNRIIIQSGIDDLDLLPFVKMLNACSVPVEQLNAVKNNAFANISNELTALRFNSSAVAKGEKDFDWMSLFPNIEYPSGNGGFDADGNYIVTSTPSAVYSNIICGEKGGFVVTQNGGGFSYQGNSYADKLTYWQNNSVLDFPSEQIYICEEGHLIRVNKLCRGGFVKHATGYTQFCGGVDKLEFEQSQYNILQGQGKVWKLSLQNHTAMPRKIEIIFKLIPSLGAHWTKDKLFDQIINDKIMRIANAENGQEMFVYSSVETKVVADDGCLQSFSKNSLGEIKIVQSDFYNPSHAIVAEIKIPSNAEKTIYFVVSKDAKLLSTLDDEEIELLIAKELDYFSNLSNIKITTADKSTDILFNKWLVYQVVSSRFNGRCGYYQVGGAIGFRDQLQDCLSLLYAQPQLVRKHILDCAEHQYIDGDVMHWWHKPKFGVRTHISDDKLFLVLLTCEYVKATGDRSILSEKIPYLISEKLSDLQESRLEIPNVSDGKESLLQHLCKAISSACQYGKHGLLLIGGGDWNDALNDIGLQKRGESVWLTMFAIYVLEKFVDLIDLNDRNFYMKEIARLKKSLSQCNRNGYYIRAITDNGELLGDIDSKFMKIDLLTQSWAVLANIGDEESQKKALSNAKMLVDEKESIIKLLSPPFDKSKYYGYISAYPQGVRENGGQYTHASVWFLDAVAKSGDSEYANKLLGMLNPIKRCQDKDKNKRYKAEPYVLAGDIYTNKNNYGRAGWTWYTGSASWLYVSILKNMLGITLEDNALCFKKPILEKWQFAKVEYRYKNSIVEIAFDEGEKTCLEINGVKYFGELRLPLKEDIPKLRIRVIFKIN